MKSKSVHSILLGLWFISSLVVGCSSEVTTPEPIEITATLTQATTRTSTVTLTSTQIPTETFSPTLTKMPTLSVAEQEARLLYLLANNDECNFPCFWGVNPSQTTLQDVNDLMSDIGAYRITFESDTTVIRHDYDIELVARDPSLLAMTVEFFEDTQTSLILGEVVYIHLDWVKPEWFDAFHVYHLNEILSMYGAPSQVLIDAAIFHGDPTSGYYAIIMHYDELDFGVQIAGQDAQLTVDSLTICPQFSTLTQITLYFEVSRIERLSVARLGNWPPGESLEDISDIDLNDFVNAFGNNPDESTCISLPEGLWPE